MRDAFTIATWCCRSWRVFDRSNPFRVAGEACTKARPSAGGAGLEPATYGSKDRRAAKLHHPPICRFARPPTRWTPPAGPDVTDTARHCDHPQTLAVPRQGGCRGEPATWIPMPADVHAWRGAYPYVPPVGFEPATGRVETACSDPLSYRGNLFPPERMSTTTRGERAGMPDSFSPAAPRYGA